MNRAGAAGQTRQDEELMRRALRLAQRAGLRGEVPVAALAVRGGVVIASAREPIAMTALRAWAAS